MNWHGSHIERTRSFWQLSSPKELETCPSEWSYSKIGEKAIAGDWIFEIFKFVEERKGKRAVCLFIFNNEWYFQKDVLCPYTCLSILAVFPWYLIWMRSPGWERLITWRCFPWPWTDWWWMDLQPIIESAPVALADQPNYSEPQAPFAAVLEEIPEAVFLETVQQ